MTIDINGDTIDEITIDGQIVKEVTADGSSVFKQTEKSGVHYYLIEEIANQEILYFNLDSPFDLANKGTADYTLSTNQRTSALTVSNDGKFLYEIPNGDEVSPDQYQKWNMSTPFDLSTASKVDTFDQFNQGNPPTCLDFADEGSKLYRNDYDGNMIQYDLSEPYDIQSASSSPSASLSANVTEGPGDPAFSPDGLKLTFGHRSDDNIVTFDLSTPFDIGTASNKVSFNTSDQDPSCVKWNADGTTAYVRHASPDMVNEYSTTTPYSVDGMSFVGQIFDNPGFAGGGHEFNYNY